MKKVISTLLLCCLFSIISQAQDRTVTITMNNSVLMCPHLGVKFKKVFSSKEYVTNVDVNQETSIASIKISDSKIKEEDFRNVIVNEVGYPEAEIGRIQFNTESK